MARWLLALVMSCVLLCADVRPAAAQHVRTSPLASLPQLYADSVPSSGKKPIPPGFGAQQALVGLSGFAVGGLAGGFVGAGLAPDNGDGWADLAGVLVGMAVGGALGSSIAVYRFSNAKGFESSYAATLVGSVAGFFGGPLLWVTVPIGSAVGYNLARK